MAGDIFTQETVDKLNASALTFNEVVTSRVGGVSTGAIIDQTLTPLGETTDTLKGRLDKLGVHISDWASTDGGTLTSPAQAFLNNTSGSAGFGNYYSWSGAYPSGGHVVAPGTDPAAVGSGYTPRTDVVLREDLADNNSTVEIGKSNAGDVGNRVSQFATDGEITGSNDSTAAAAVSVNGIRTTINRHAFEDWTQLNTTDSNMGYASFDAKPTLNNSSNQEHFVGYQSRPVYAGAGDLTGYCHGYNTQLTLSGSGDVNGVIGLSIANPNVTGSGRVLNLIGLQISDLTAGQQYNYSIFTGLAPSRFGGPLQLAGSSNSTITDGTAWVWTSDGSPGGIKSGGVYFSTGGGFQVFTKNFDTLISADENGVQSVKDFTAEKKFGCNGKLPQGSATVNAACTDLPTAIALINQLRSALIANGICV